MPRVDGLHAVVSLGEWRGHEISYLPEDNRYRSESAGVEGKTLAEVKRLIDAQEKRTYRAKDVLDVAHTYGGDIGKPYALTKPANSLSRWGGKEPEVWVVDRNGNRSKRALKSFVDHTPANLEKIARYKALQNQAKALQNEAVMLLDDIPRATMPEEIEPGE